MMGRTTPYSLGMVRPPRSLTARLRKQIPDESVIDPDEQAERIATVVWMAHLNAAIAYAKFTRHWLSEHRTK